MNSSQLLILGNGFDKHCGLASTYKDFFRSALLDIDGERYGLKQLQAGVSGFWESLLIEYFKVYDRDDYNWCNVEEIIKNTLCSIFTQKKYDGIELWQIANANANSNQINEFSIGITSNPIDFFLYKYCTAFFRRSSRQAERVEQDLLRHILQQLNNLEKRFCKYLKNQIINPNNPKKLYENYIVNSVNLLAKLTGFATTTFRNINDIIRQEYGEVERENGSNRTVISFEYFNVLSKGFSKLRTVNILSFNYTALFNILGVKCPCVYSNVHGKLCNEKCTGNCNSSSVIFGIDDRLIQEDPEAFELRIFSKTHRKMLATEKPLNILPPNNNYPIEIKFYGHSLSEADYSYFQSIFDYYDLYGNNNVSLIFYYSNGYEQHDAIYSLISEYGKSLTNKEQGKNLIHKLLLENRLQIQEIKE